MNGSFWKGLLDWFRTTLVNEGMISADDMDLIQIIEKPEDVVEAIFEFYEDQDQKNLNSSHKSNIHLAL